MENQKVEKMESMAASPENLVSPNTTPKPEPVDPVIRIELEYNLGTQERLVIRSKAATVMLEGILAQCIKLTSNRSDIKNLRLPADGVVRVLIEYDMKRGRPVITAQVPSVILDGILQHALGSLTRNQMQQHLQIITAKLEQLVTDLERRMSASALSRLVLPS